MTVLGYYGLLRIGEMATGSHPIKAKDVHVARQKGRIMLVLFTSKTHGLDKMPQKIHIWRDSRHKTNFDPVTILDQYSQARGGYVELSEPYFIFQDGTPVKPAHYRKVLRKTLTNLGLNPKLYDTHSLRIGRASDLMKFGYSVDRIKQLGRWKSNAVFKYIKN